MLRSFVYVSEEEKYDVGTSVLGPMCTHTSVCTQAQRCLLKVFQTLVELLPDNLILKEGSAEVSLLVDDGVSAN